MPRRSQYQPQPYGLVPMPQPESPMQTLAGMMQLVGGAQRLQQNATQLEEERAATTERKAIEAAYTDSRGNITNTIERLEQGGFWKAANTFREKKTQLRDQQVSAIHERMGLVASTAGKGTQLLNEIEAQPELYPQMRPTLIELASQIHPSLAQEIPEQYDPARVRGMIQFTVGAAAHATERQRAAAALAASFTAQKAGLEQDALQHTAMSRWFGTSDSQEDWDAALDHARDWGVSDTVLAKVGPTWSPDAAERARQLGLTAEQRGQKETSIDAAILAARGRGETAEVTSLVRLKRRLSEAGREGKQPLDPDAVQAVLKNPSIWGDVTPSLRDQLLVPLSSEGFDFKGAARSLSDTQKAQIERWKTDQLSTLNRERRNPQSLMTPDEFTAEQARIEDSYTVQMGLGRSKAGHGIKGNVDPGAAQEVPAAVAVALKAQKAGRYTLSDGSKWLVNADGSIAPAK